MNTTLHPSSTLRAVLVEDEPLCRETLRELLVRECLQVTVVAEADSVAAAVECIPRAAPDLLFLDVELPDGTGFDVLEYFHREKCRVIFTTAHNEYAVRAIRFAALDYLLKPIDADELRCAVARASAPRATAVPRDADAEETRSLVVCSPQDVDARIAVPTVDGLTFLALRHIVWCEAASNYTILHCRDGTQRTSTRSLHEFEELLSARAFIRIHHSYIINLAHIERYVKGRGGYVVMNGGKELEVSTRRRDEFLRRLGG
ncbi:MAG: response regulator transcription factor [Ignavibacteriae bacterium]|nr:response regulator transcription factor [Ignavibacteriota bacterium]